mmetsp:Transcript_54610/g.140570  ORF Transcript_54610/g.140570 Transcript_54610/m.140570 type:complete len:167 (+) Transcript_54610:85-585(+)
MARLTLAVVLALATSAAAFNVGGLPEHRVTKDVNAPQRFAPQEVKAPTDNVSAGVAAIAVAAVVGVLAGLILGPTVASAVSSQPLPSFRVTRPEYMQGVDASNAAIWPGQTDFVTRSQMEALTFPQAREQLQQEQTAIKAAPSKERRVGKEQQKMQELATLTEIPS